MSKRLFVALTLITISIGNVTSQKVKAPDKDGKVQVVYKGREDVGDIRPLPEGGFLLEIGKNIVNNRKPRLLNFNSNLESKWAVRLSEPKKEAQVNCLISSRFSNYVYHIWSESKIVGNVLSPELLRVSRIDENGQKQDLKCRKYNGKYDNETPVAFFQNSEKLFFVSIQWTDPRNKFGAEKPKSEWIKTPWRREIVLYSMGHQEADFVQSKLEIPFTKWNVSVLANLEFLANDSDGFYLGKKEMKEEGFKVNEVIYHFNYKGELLDSAVFDFKLKSAILPTFNINEQSGAYCFENGILSLPTNIFVRGYHTGGAYKDDWSTVNGIITHLAFGNTRLDLKKRELIFYGLCVKPDVRWKSATSYNLISVSSGSYMGVGIAYNQVVMLRYSFITGELLEEKYRDIEISKKETEEVVVRTPISTDLMAKGLSFYAMNLMQDSINGNRLFIVGKKTMRVVNFNAQDSVLLNQSMEVKNKFTSDSKKLLENRMHYAYLLLGPRENNPLLTAHVNSIEGKYRKREQSVFAIREENKMYVFENASFTKHPQLKISQYNYTPKLNKK